jgi:hypothetical protein
MSDHYQIITGIVSELEIFDTEQQFLKTRKLAGLPALGLFFLGDVVAAASQLNTTDSNEEAAEFLNSVQYFRCKMGSNIIEGIFCRVFFNNGDQVEVVVEPRSDGSYFAYALRRLIDHRLWLHPWATKGTKAGNKSALKFAVSLMSVIFVFTIIFMLINTSLDEYYIFLIALPVILVLDILLGVLVYFLHKSILSKGSHIADKIFATLGYADPKRVDMEAEFYKFYAYRDENLPNFYVDINSAQYKQQPPEGAKWVTFYREAPPIPEYIKVIHTKSEDMKSKDDD